MALSSKTNQIARRYALALLNGALEANTLDTVCRDVQVLQELLNGNEEFSRVVKSPAISMVEAKEVLNEVLTSLKLCDLIQGLAQVLCDNRRQFALSNALEAFNDLVNEHNGVVKAEVISAVELSDAQKATVDKAVASAVGGDVRVAHSVKSAIIGGLIVKVGSRMLDVSIQTKIDKLKLEMKGA